MSDEPEPTMRLATGRNHVVSVCPCAGCTHARDQRTVLTYPPLKVTITERVMARLRATPGAFAAFAASLAPEPAPRPHPDWHPSHREIL